MSERRGGYHRPKKSPALAGEQKHRAVSQKSNKSSDNISDTPLDLQARKLRQAYAFAYSTAVMIAGLAYAGGPR